MKTNGTTKHYVMLHVASYKVSLHYITLHGDVLYFVTLCSLWYITLDCITLCYITSQCYIMLCNIT